MAFRLVLFDMDGTLVDSIPAWHRTFNVVRRLQGLEDLSYGRFCRDVLGQSAAADVERFFPSIDVTELSSLYDRYFPDNISSVRLFPETLAVLDYLEGHGVRKGIVTNTQRGLMHMTLERVKLAGRFDFLLSGTDVSVGKPDPEIIHSGCRLACIGEDEALLVGDTQADIRAGAAAGVKTIGVGVKGDWRIKSIGEFLKLFEKINKCG